MPLDSSKFSPKPGSGILMPSLTKLPLTQKNPYAAVRTTLPFWDEATAFGVEVDDNTYTNIDANGWGRGACYAYPLTGDFRFEYTLPDTAIARWVGISDTPTLNYANAEWYIYTVNGTAAAYDNGAPLSRTGRYVAGDTISIERIGSTLIFEVNGVAFYVNQEVNGTWYLCSAVYTQGQSLTVTRVGADIEAYTDLAPNDLSSYTTSGMTVTDQGGGVYRLTKTSGGVSSTETPFAGTTPYYVYGQFDAKCVSYDGANDIVYAMTSTYGYYAGFSPNAGTLAPSNLGALRYIEALGDGWYRCRYVTVVAGGPNFRIQENAGSSVYDIRNPIVIPLRLDPGELGAFFDAWFTSTATFTSGETDPDGGSNAWELTPTGPGGHVQYNFPGGEVLGRQIKVTVDAKMDTYDGAYPFLYVLGSRTWYRAFNLVSGSTGSSAAVADSSIANLGSGWYRLSVTTNDPVGCGAYIRLRAFAGTSVYHLYNCKVTAVE
jgi:hypothetical protein